MIDDFYHCVFFFFGFRDWCRYISEFDRSSERAGERVVPFLLYLRPDSKTNILHSCVRLMVLA